MGAKALFCSESLSATVKSKTRINYLYIDQKWFYRAMKPILDQLKQNAEVYNDMMKLLIEQEQKDDPYFFHSI
jgi:hypothetical protein